METLPLEKKNLGVCLNIHTIYAHETGVTSVAHRFAIQLEYGRIRIGKGC